MAAATLADHAMQIHGADFGNAGGTVLIQMPQASDTAAAANTATDAAVADAAEHKSPQNPAAATSRLPNGTQSGQRQQLDPQPQLPKPQRPQVSVSYARLPPKSKERLEEALIGWAAWHAAAYGDETEEGDSGGLITNITPVQQQPKCSGRLRFEPFALSTAAGGTSDLSIAAANAWVDIPEAAEAADEQESIGKAKFNLEYEKAGGVPKYDRGVIAPLGGRTAATPDGAAPSPAPPPRPGRTPQRCFDCGSYSHALRDCWQPRDSAAVHAARAEYSASSGATIAGMKLPTRYFVSIDGAADSSDAVLGDTSGGGGATAEASGLAPGCLSAELRAALGIPESAPPPWLARMRKLGYPPGYLLDDEAVAHTEDADALELVFGDDAPAQMQAAWSAPEPAVATTATAPTSPPDETGAGAGAAAGEAVGSRKQDEAATPAEAELVSQLVAAIGGAFFDNGDIRGVKPVGGGQWSGDPASVELRLAPDIAADIARAMPFDKAARLAAAQLAAGGGNALTKKQVRRALVMAGKRRIAFPGFNAPLPSNAEVAAWSAKEGGGKVLQGQGQQRQALAGSKRMQPEPLQLNAYTGTGTGAAATAAGTSPAPQGQQQKRQRTGGTAGRAAVHAGGQQQGGGHPAVPQPPWPAMYANGQHTGSQPVRATYAAPQQSHRPAPQQPLRPMFAPQHVQAPGYARPPPPQHMQSPAALPQSAVAHQAPPHSALRQPWRQPSLPATPPQWQPRQQQPWPPQPPEAQPPSEWQAPKQPAPANGGDHWQQTFLTPAAQQGWPRSQEQQPWQQQQGQLPWQQPQQQTPAAPPYEPPQQQPSAWLTQQYQPREPQGQHQQPQTQQPQPPQQWGAPAAHQPPAPPEWSPPPDDSNPQHQAPQQQQPSYWQPQQQAQPQQSQQRHRAQGHTQPVYQPPTVLPPLGSPPHSPYGGTAAAHVEVGSNQTRPRFAGFSMVQRQ